VSSSSPAARAEDLLAGEDLEARLNLRWRLTRKRACSWPGQQIVHGSDGKRPVTARGLEAST
jgi:hypothetical protein